MHDSARPEVYLQYKQVEMFTPDASRPSDPSSSERSHLSSSHPNIPVVRTNKQRSSQPSPAPVKQPLTSHFTPYFDPTPGPTRFPVRQNLAGRYPSPEVPETVVQVPPAPLGDELRNFPPPSQFASESMPTPTPSMQENVVPVPVHYPPMMQPGGVSDLPRYPPTTQTDDIYAPSSSSPMLVNYPPMTQQAGISQPSQYPTTMPHAVPGQSYQLIIRP